MEQSRRRVRVYCRVSAITEKAVELNPDIRTSPAALHPGCRRSTRFNCVRLRACNSVSYESKSWLVRVYIRARSCAKQTERDRSAGIVASFTDSRTPLGLRPVLSQTHISHLFFNVIE